MALLWSSSSSSKAFRDPNRLRINLPEKKGRYAQDDILTSPARVNIFSSAQMCTASKGAPEAPSSEDDDPFELAFSTGLRSYTDIQPPKSALPFPVFI
jgi:hypothetical protein